MGSLFSGIGGFDLGLEQAGHQVEFQCEIDEWRRSVLARHWPGLPTVFDVRDVGTHTVRPVELLCGGFPCQDLSVAGQRAGLQGPRSSLFFEFARAADRLVGEGGWVLVENVPGLLSSNGGRDFAVVLATLADLGFHDLAWRVLDSRYFGVPQRRRRVFVLARRAAGRSAARVLLEPESRSRHSEASDQARPASGSGADERSAADSEPVYWVEDNEFGTLKANGSDGFPRTDRQPLVLANAVTRRYGKGVSSTGTEAMAVVAIAENQRNELREMEIMPQLTGGGGKPGRGYPAVSGEMGVRRLTPTECERLQGFPDGWTQHGPDTRRYAALGDAVTVPVVRWVGQRLATFGVAGCLQQRG